MSEKRSDIDGVADYDPHSPSAHADCSGRPHHARDSPPGPSEVTSETANHNDENELNKDSPCDIDSDLPPGDDDQEPPGDSDDSAEEGIETDDSPMPEHDKISK